MGFIWRIMENGFSPKCSQESAVVSKDVGNFSVCVVVIWVLCFKVTYDVSLAPLLNKETNIFIYNNRKFCNVLQTLCACVSLTSTALTSSNECISFTGSTCCWRMKSAMAATDLWPLYSLFIIIPLRNNFNVGYLVMRYLWAMSATQRQRQRRS